MAKLKAFKELRPPKISQKQLASRPYDVLNSKARIEAEVMNILFCIIKPEIDLPENVDEHDEAVYQKTKKVLKNSKKLILFKMKRAFVYYAQTMNGKTQMVLLVVLVLMIT